jgi:hypothetical protein
MGDNMHDEIQQHKQAINAAKRAKALIGEAQGIMRQRGVTIDSEVAEALGVIDTYVDHQRRELGQLIEIEP